ncbi:hypothetical protein BDN70DRAFT_957985 [Pholiota conissans]|uniref:Fungal-type protein kinase domain-containing protein n=1 Tax=Pholiota conissans TaxID=109636 RepID=A0A9P5YWF6_9AGAR|nr:hypothetical protein BDN70DRAFT_957985 [Pholiota conissans]
MPEPSPTAPDDRTISSEQFYSAPKTPQGRPMRAFPKSTPPDHKLAGSLPNANTTMEAAEIDSQLSKEMKGHFVGSMPPRVFIAKLVQKSGLPECPYNATAWARVYRPSYTKEDEMYEPFVTAVAAFTPGMKFVDTHKHPDNDANGYAPDVAGYDLDDFPDSGKTTDFSKMSIFLEFKLDKDADPFEDPPVPAPKTFNKKNFHFERDTKESKLFRSQIGRYSASISGTQFRLHTFSVSIYGGRARFIRWDRAGAIVSQSFDYLQSPDILSFFFWCYSHSSRRDQGHDPSVSKPSNVEAYDASEAFMREKNISYDKFLKVMVPDRENSHIETPVLIPCPLEYLCHSPFARATRPTPAYDMIGKRLVFMKDYWRPKDNLKEGDIYAHLHDHGVQHIAEFGAGNDVRDHVTLTAKFAKEQWSCFRAPGENMESMMPELVQYRMTLLAIGWRLDDYYCTKNFVSAVKDAMEAHDDAYFKAKVLHRDISAGNILLTSKGGLLIDWDMSVMIDPKPQIARRPKRTGTWQFMSVKLLEKPDKVQDILDDRESAFWVILWIALRTRYSHSVEDDVEADELLPMFDHSFTNKRGKTKGGEGKRSFLTKPIPVAFDGVPHLNALLTELRKAFRDHVLEDGANKEEFRSQGWLVGILQKYLNKSPWPTSDYPNTLEFVRKLTAGNKRSAGAQFRRTRTVT